MFRPINLAIIFLVLLPFVSATFPVSLDVYLTHLMESDPYSICYKSQSGDALLIIPTVQRNTASGPIEVQSDLPKRDLADRLCRKESSDFSAEPSPECITSKEAQIIALNPGETACDYAQDPSACYSCSTPVKFKQAIKEYTLLSAVIGSLILLPLSLLYFVINGVYYLFKRKLLGPKWLLFTAIILFVLSLLSLLYSIRII